MREQISLKNTAPAVGPYSLAIKQDGWLFVSGRIHTDKDGNLIVGSTEEMTKSVLQNIEDILKEAGMTFDNVVSTTVYLTDMSLYKGMNEVYSTYFTGSFPARETVCVKELPKGAKIEMSMIAKL